MARDYTTTGLIESIERRSSIPVNQSTFTEARLIAFADDEMQNKLVPLVRANRKSHFVRFEDVTLTSSVEYDIPEEALNRGVYNVAVLGADNEPYSLIYIDFDREIDVSGYWASYVRRSPDSRLGYYLRGDKLYLYPESQSGKTLRIYFEQLPNQLVSSDEAALVSSVDSGTGIVTCASIPGTWQVGDSACCVQGSPGFDLRFAARAFTGVSSPTVTFDDVTGIEAGDWIALEGDSPVIQLPVETHGILAQAVAVKVLEALGDQNLPNAQRDWAAVVTAYEKSYTRRVDARHERIHSRQRLADWLV